MAPKTWWHVRIGRIVAVVVCLALTTLSAGARMNQSVVSASRSVYVVDSNNGTWDSRVMVVDVQRGQVVSTLKTAYRAHKPDIALSSDGRRLYAAYSTPTPPENLLQGILEVFDTATGNSLFQTPNPDRWLSTLPYYSSQMALSDDDRWLFQMKMRMEGDGLTSYYIDTFDTLRNAFLPQSVPLPMCVSGLIVPSRIHRQTLSVLCSHTQDLRMLTVTEAGAASERPWSLAVTDARQHGHPATAFVSSGRLITAISSEGDVLKADSDSREIVSKDRIDGAARKSSAPEARQPQQAPPSGSPDDWLAGRWIRRQPAVLAASGTELYLGLDSLAEKKQGREAFKEVVVLDTQSLDRVRTIQLRQPVYSISLSRDGRQLYAVDAQDSTLFVIDALSGKELRAIRGVGTTPIFALSAP